MNLVTDTVISTAVSINMTCPSGPVRKYSTTIDAFRKAKIILSYLTYLL